MCHMRMTSHQMPFKVIIGQLSSCPVLYCEEKHHKPSPSIAASAFLRRVAQCLETAMHAGLEAGAQRHQRVFSVQLVRACPFYGYHPGERLFMKIIMCAFLLSPYTIH